MEHSVVSSQVDAGRQETNSIASVPMLASSLSFLGTIWRKTRSSAWSVRERLGVDTGRSLDVERISAHLEIVKRATEEGGRDLPPSSEEVLSGTQREIIAYFADLRRRARQRIVAGIEKSGRVLEQIQASDSLTKIRDIPAGCENKILRRIADYDFLLNNTAEREQRQSQHYEAFRKKNGLNRVASYPRVAPYSYLLVPVLVAAVAYVLAKTIETGAGSTAGISIAWIVGVSAAAVTVPFIFGDSLLRWINHAGEFRQFTGWISAIVAIALVVGMAFYADFHIASMLAATDASSRSILEAMLVAPLDVVASVADWRVFGLVALSGLAAMILAYRFDDPYPGYGAVQRSYHEARNAREATYARLRKRINVLIDGAEAEIDSAAKAFKSKAGTYTRMVEKAARDSSALKDYDVELEDACNIVLDRYRMANAAARQSDTPFSFAEHACFNPSDELDPRQHANGSSHVAELQSAIAELESEANSARRQLRDLNRRMISSMSEPPVKETDSAA